MQPLLIVKHRMQHLFNNICIYIWKIFLTICELTFIIVKFSLHIKNFSNYMYIQSETSDTGYNLACWNNLHCHCLQYTLFIFALLALLDTSSWWSWEGIQSILHHKHLSANSKENNKTQKHYLSMFQINPLLFRRIRSVCLKGRKKKKITQH